MVDYHRNCFSHAASGCCFHTIIDRTKFRLSSELLLPFCIGMLFSYNYRPYEMSIIIGIVAPMLHGDSLFIQVSTVRNFDYHRNCFSHAEWGCFFFYKCRPYEISIIIGIVAPMLHGDSFFYKCRPYEISIIIGIVAPIQFSNNHIHFFHRSRAKVMIFKIQVGERQEFQCTQPEYGCIGQFSNNHIHFSSDVSGKSNDFQNPGGGEATIPMYTTRIWM